MNIVNKIIGRRPTYQEITNPEYALSYAKDVVRRRVPALEPVILKDFVSAIMYARDVLGGRWPELEKRVETVHQAYWYAREVIHGRWPEKEPLIAQYALWSVQYARDVLKRRFPSGEQAICGSESCRKAYLVLFPEARDDWMVQGWIDWME